MCGGGGGAGGGWERRDELRMDEGASSPDEDKSLPDKLNNQRLPTTPLAQALTHITVSVDGTGHWSVGAHQCHNHLKHSLATSLC